MGEIKSRGYSTDINLFKFMRRPLPEVLVRILYIEVQNSQTARELHRMPKVPRPSGSGTKPSLASAKVLMSVESFHVQQATGEKMLCKMLKMSASLDGERVQGCCTEISQRFFSSITQVI